MIQQPLELRLGKSMNDNTRIVGSSRYLDVAEQWAAEQGWHHWNAARWIRGLAGGMHRLDPRKDGFHAEDVVRVVQAWHGDDWEVWEGGFVVELRDGRYARLECFALLFDWSYPDESRVTVSIEPKGYDEKIANRWDPTIASSKTAPTCLSCRTISTGSRRSMRGRHVHPLSPHRASDRVFEEARAPAPHRRAL